MVVGLYFGSFNPIHNGHLRIASKMLEEHNCDEVWFVVSPQNPFKTNATLLDEQKRYELVSAAIYTHPHMKVSDIEFTMPRPSYTINTLGELKRQFPENTYVLIMGGDNLASFEYWKSYEIIEREFSLFVYPRPNSVLPEALKNSVHILDGVDIPISSTEIRERIQNGMDISLYVPLEIVGKVNEYYRTIL